MRFPLVTQAVEFAKVQTQSSDCGTRQPWGRSRQIILGQILFFKIHLVIGEFVCEEARPVEFSSP
jgi:hypothetical protein